MCKNIRIKRQSFLNKSQAGLSLVRKGVVVVLIWIASIGTLHAQDVLHVFLDCDRCDFNYIRTEIPIVDYVRTPDQAHLHVLVTDEQSASGGHVYAMSFIGRQRYENLSLELSYSASPDETESQVREGIAEVLEIGLVPYIAQTSLFSRLSISYDAPAGDNLTRPAHDPWNNWVFDIGVGGGLDKETRESEYEIDADLSANRVTEHWRILTDIEIDYDYDLFEQDERTITSRRYSREFSGRIIKSLSDHWSAGLFGETNTSTFDNIAWSVGLRPAVEYSIYPYREVNRREFTVAYHIGPEVVHYFEETIYAKTSELLVRESIEMRVEFKQPWGTARFIAGGSHFFHDLSKYSVDLSGRISVRLYKGLAMNASFGIDRIRDQLFLPKGDATLEEVLLRVRRLETTFELSASLGISYTFGSIYNNIVNTRL